MKALFFSLALCFAFALNTQAQDYKTAIGLRLGAPVSVSLKHFLNEKGAVEAFAGFRNYSGYGWFNAGAMYQHHSAIKEVEGLKWYWGVGGAAYFWNYDFAGDYASTTFGILGALGLDYKFATAPVNLSVDWVPAIFIGNGYTSGFGAGYGALSARYVFK